MSRLVPDFLRTGASTGILWINENREPPFTSIMDVFRRDGDTIRELVWMRGDGGRPYGRVVTIGRPRRSRDYPMTVRLVSPRLLVSLLRANEDVVLVEQMNLLALYAVASKLGRRRKVLVLVEGDYGHLGKSGTAVAKVALRRLNARFIDVFIANNESAEKYLRRELRVPPNKIVVGWWLAGLPSNGVSSLQPKDPPAREGPIFLTACSLIPRKGVDLLLDAVAEYHTRFGPCRLWIVGEGPEHRHLVEHAQRLGIADSVVFQGFVDHERFKKLLGHSHIFVLPTLQDLVGRVVVEALTAGVPVVVSRFSGAAGTVLHDDVNGFVVDPRDRYEFAETLRRAVQVDTHRRLVQGVEEMRAELFPDAAARVVRRAVDLARAQ